MYSQLNCNDCEGDQNAAYNAPVVKHNMEVDYQYKENSM
jgi:hypothetical protein